MTTFGAPYSMYDERLGEEAVGQGDILLWDDAVEPLLRAGVVVTGDCDIANNKCWGRLSVVPIIPAEYYLDNLRIPQLLDKEEENVLKQYRQALECMLKKEGREVTSAAIDLLLREGGLPEAFKGDRIKAFWHSFLRTKATCLNSESQKQLLFGKYEFDREGKEKGAVVWRKKATELLSNLPGDLMQLSGIAGLDMKLPLIWLRAIREIPVSGIALKNSDEKKGMAVRIGRLRETYKYKLTQQLGHVFSDIGLPDAHENALKKIRIDYINDISGKSS